MLPLPSDYGRPTAGFDHVGGDGGRSLGPMLGRIGGEVERFSGGALKSTVKLVQ